MKLSDEVVKELNDVINDLRMKDYITCKGDVVAMLSDGYEASRSVRERAAKNLEEILSWE